MSTGYTSDVAENNISFEEFVWRCARAFGPLMHMRDDSFNAPIRMPDEDGYSYYKEALDEARAELEKYSNMSLEDAEICSQKEYDYEVQYTKDCLDKANKTYTRYNEMLQKVIAWQPPSKDHDNLKSFMVEQLQQSIKYDCDMDHPIHSLDTLTKCPAKEWLDFKIKDIESNIERYSKQLDKENRNNQFCINWINLLKSNIPIPPPK